jgi:hypothetical protein
LKSETRLDANRGAEAPGVEPGRREITHPDGNPAGVLQARVPETAKTVTVKAS